MTPTSTFPIAWKLGLFAAAMITLLAMIAAAIIRPIGGDTDSYRADFTDASGLKTGDDVRMFGVAVGKVAEISLVQGRARVEFTVHSDRPLYDASSLAIRYQSLTGQRYIDIRQPEHPTPKQASTGIIGTDRTIGSFDITRLFNGLQPVLQEFSPGALNQFTESVLAVIEGNGSGIGPALDAIEKLSAYVTDRQTVISTIVANLESISTRIGGKSPHLITLLRGLTDVFTAFQEKLDGLIDFASVAPSALGPLNSLLATLGFTETTNPHLERDLRLLFPDPDIALDQLGKLPGLLQSLSTLVPASGSAVHVDLTCSKGNAEVPSMVAVLIAGQRIAICKN
ncbi:MlaD family protein [Nocardia sp. NBC_01009]|uniref:MlaD family protein n=1 Tax=Nocardia sp. NBC_01009 TaxID=2975996 RepID=UPI003863C023|nr:MlaD family protein [Nocardia sp. NBC_01009]